MDQMVCDSLGVCSSNDDVPASDPTYSDNIELPNAEAQHMYDMLDSFKKPLWPGCETSQLEAVTEMLSLKSKLKLTEQEYDLFSDFAKRISHAETTLPESFYETRKLVEGLGLPFELIDCCKNGCMIFWGLDENMTTCKICGHARFKQGKVKPVPYVSMFYLPITKRLQRLYASETTAKHMRWHDEHIQQEGVMLHPSDTDAWKHFNHIHMEFAAESRNVRIGLCINDFNLFGLSGQKYSCWPIIMTPYNLPPSMCMKDEVMFLSVIIPGPQNPKQRLDVYLQPLISELTNLWHCGVITYDVSKKQNFVMHAAVIWTISNFPAYSMLSGWSSSGRYACPHCMEDTEAFYLKNGQKMSWFDCHRKFLPANHRFRQNKTDFIKGKRVMRSPPTIRSGVEVLNQIERMTLLKSTENGSEEHNSRVSRGSGWKKRSIFWDLPYWSSLRIRHNLDVMDIEKNCFDDVFNTIVDIPGKSKDNLRARLDLRDICRRPELESFDEDTKYPKANYTLNHERKKVLFDWLRHVKFPDGYGSNLNRCTDLQKLKIFSMKHHDCHVFMQRLLPVAFRPFLLDKYWEPIAQLSAFFRDLTCYELDATVVRRLHDEVPILICKLERFMPPTFFDLMEHLTIHLPMEAATCGPVQYRWTYPFERFLRRLKNSIGNKAKVEDSICSAYIAQETSTFCKFYFNTQASCNQTKLDRNAVDTLEEGVDPNDLSIFTTPGRLTGRAMTRLLTDDEYHLIQTFVLLNCDEVQPFIQLYVTQYVRPSHQSISASQEQAIIDKYFSPWFYYYVDSPRRVPIDDNIRLLARGPTKKVKTYTGYIGNGFWFQTKGHSTMQSTKSSGICVLEQHNGNEAEHYYGELDEIIELNYVSPTIKRVVIFNGSWFDTLSQAGTRLHNKIKLADVNKHRKLMTKDRYIFAHQAMQIYYLEYPIWRREDAQWMAVCKVKPRKWKENAIDTTEQAAPEPFQHDSASERVIEDLDQDDDHVGSRNDPDGTIVVDNIVELSESDEELYSDDDTDEDEF